MAFQTEVFEGQFNLKETGVEDLITSLEKLDKIAERIKKSLGSFTIKIPKIDASPLEQVSKGTEKAATEVKKAVKDIEKTVTSISGTRNSAFDDIVADIQAKFASLPQKTEPAVFKLKKQFGDLRKDLSYGLKEGIADVLTDDFKKLSSELDSVSLKQLKLIQQAQQAKAETAGTKANVGGDTKSAKSSAQTFINEEQAARQLAFSQNLVDQFNRVGDAGGAASVGLKQRFDGLSLAVSGTGNRLQGLREAFAGTTSSSNLFVKSLDFMIQKQNPLNKLSNDLSQSIAGIADKAALASRALERQGDILGQKIKQELGDSTRAADEFNKQATKVTAALDQIQVTATKGGDISAALIRAQVAVKGLEDEYKLLVQSGVIKAGTESDTMFKAMIQNAKVAANNVQAMSARYEGTKKEIAAVKQKQDEQTNSTTRQITVFGNLQIKLSNLFNIFRQGKAATDQTTQGIKNMETGMRSASVAADSFKGSLLGAFGGTLIGNLTNLVPNLFGALQQKFTSSIQAASDVEEEMGKFAVVFDSSADAAKGMGDSLVQNVITEVDNMADRLNRSKYELRAFAASFQDTFVPLGYTREAAAQLSIGLTGLTEDLSSFYNMSEKEVSDRITSFLVGNYENARAFGVVVNDAALDAELLKMGIAGGTQAVDQQTKSLVALKLLYAGTADAQGDVERTATSFANQLREVQGRAHEAAVEFGQRLLPLLNPLLSLFIRLSSEVGPRLSQVFANITATITPISDALVNLVSTGSIDEIMTTILDNLSNMVVSMMDNLNSFIPYAADWAYGWVTEIYNGLIEGADSLIASAMDYIGSLVSGFLQPGSPPEEGPLSSIDKWGEGLMSTFTDSMSNVDTKPLEQGLGAISNVFDRFDLGAAQADVMAIQQQIIDAEAQGFVPAELKKQLALAQDKVTLLQQQASLQDQVASGAEKTTKADEVGKKGGGSSAGGGVSNPKERVGQEKKTAEQIRTESLAVLEKQLKDGVIKYEDYAKERLKIEEKFYQDTAEAGGAVNEQTIKDIKFYQAEVDRIAAESKASKGGKKKDGSLLGLGDIGLKIEDVIPNPVNLQNQVKKTVQQVADVAVVAISDKFDQAKGKIFTKVSESFTSAVSGIGESFSKIKDAIPPSFIPGIALLVGYLASLAAPSVIAGIGAVAVQLASFAGAIVNIISVAARFTVVGLIVTAIILNWDKIAYTAGKAFEYLSDLFKQFVQNAGGMDAVKAKVALLFNSIKTEATKFATSVLDAVKKVVTDLDFVGAFDSLKKAFGQIDLSGLSVSFGDLFEPLVKTINDNLPKLKTKLLKLIPPKLLEQINQITASFSGFFAQGRLGGELLNLFRQLGELFSAELPIMKGIGIALGIIAGIIVNVLVSALQGLGAALPFIEVALAGVVMVVTGVVDIITGAVLGIRAVWAYLTGDSESASQLTQQAFQNLASGITNIFGGIYQTIIGVGTGILTFITSFVLSFVANVLSFIPGFQTASAAIYAFRDGVVSILSGMVTQATAILYGLSNQLKIILPAAWEFLLGTISGFVGSVIDWFTNLYTELVGQSIIPDMVNAIIEWLMKLPEQGVAMVISFATRMASKFGEIKSKLVDAGKNMILGILEGLKQNSEKLFEYLKSIAQDALSSFASQLGIQSPSVKFAELGVNLIQGLVKGIQSKVPTLRDTINGVADTVEDQLEDAFDNTKGHAVLSLLKRGIQENYQEIVSSTLENGTDLLLGTFSARGLGIKGGVQAEQLEKAARDFIIAIKAEKEANTTGKAFASEQISLLDKITKAKDETFGKFNQQVFNITNAATEARIELERMFNRTVTDNEVANNAAGLASKSIDQMTEKEKLLASNFILQNKMNGALEQEAKIRQSVLKFGDISTSIGDIKSILNSGKTTTEAKAAGNSILSALGLGIEAGADETLAKLAETSASIIAQIKKAMGIASPSTVFMGFGEQLMAGLAIGISKTSGQVTAAMQGVNSNLRNFDLTSVPSLSTNYNQGLALAGATASSSGQPIQIINHNNITDRFDQTIFDTRVEQSVIRAIRNRR